MSSFGGVIIPFSEWREACQRQTSQSGKEVLQEEAKKLFSTLFSTTTFVVGDGNGALPLTTKSAHQEALAQLLRELGPCFNATHMTRVWALHCLCGAVEGCPEVSQVMMNLLGNFLLTLCAPLEEDSYGEDIEEVVRDTAVLCLAALVKSVVLETDDAVARQRVYLAQTGVERRCATAEQDESMDHGYDAAPQKQDVCASLSLLPRSRRALCFDLIRAAVDGVAMMPALVDSSASLAKFTSFSANCLHGESDPRCLMQLLVTLRSLQGAFLTHFVSSDTTQTFPTVDLFDAVAPYYPIQFTPPPNDKYGITRQGLQQALLAIFCFDGYDEPGDRNSMLNLSASLVIERLEEDVSTVQDKLDTIQDLTILLATPTNMSPESIRELSHALIATHSHGAEGVAVGKPGLYKALADSCRSLVSNVSADLELNNDLWNVFVKETLQSDASLLATTPQSMKGRSTIAYLACLAASGGPRTLSATLENCLPRLQDVLCQVEDDEKVAAAAYGICAFFSSFDVAFRRAREKSISFHPHPLEPYSCKILALLGDLFRKSRDEATKIAVVSAMLSLLTVTPSDLLDETVQVVIDFVQDSCVLVRSTETDDEELRGVVAKSLGRIIAFAMDDGESQVPSVLCDNDEVRASIQEIIFPTLMKSCLETSVAPGERYDVLSLAYACADSQLIADQVLDSIVSALHKSLIEGDKSQAVGAALLVSVILDNGKTHAQTAFHKTQVDPVELLKILGHASSDDKSVLELSPSSNEVDADMPVIDFGYEIVSRFIPAFQVALPETRLNSLFDYMSHILPPLSDWQKVQLSTCLPLFSVTVMENDVPERLHSQLLNATTPLAEFALDSQNYPRSRSDSAACLFWIVFRHQQADQSEGCLAKRILEKTVFPEIRTRLQLLQDPRSGINGDAADAFRDALNMASVLGSAAACRGAKSSHVSDVVARYLIKLALIGETQDPYTSSHTIVFASGFQIQVTMHLTAASAYGSLISVDCGGPFWKQRLLHIALKELEAVVPTSDVNDPSFWGRLTLIAQVIACGNITAISKSTRSMLVNTLMSDLLAIHPKDVTDQLSQLMVTPDIMALQELVLAGIIKLAESSHMEVSKYVANLLPAMLRILSRGNLTGCGSMALALQILCTVCTFEDEKTILLAFKPAVESVLLQILDHPIYAFRQMVAETRNYWAIVT